MRISLVVYEFSRGEKSRGGAKVPGGMSGGVNVRSECPGVLEPLHT